MSCGTISSSQWRAMRVSSMTHSILGSMPQLPWFEIFVGSYLVWVLLACASLLMSRRSPQATLAWMFAFIALPVVSGFYYLLFGPRRLLRRKRRYGLARAEASKVSDYLRRTACETQPQLSIDAAGLAS